MEPYEVPDIKRYACPQIQYRVQRGTLLPRMCSIKLLYKFSITLGTNLASSCRDTVKDCFLNVRTRFLDRECYVTVDQNESASLVVAEGGNSKMKF